MCVINNLSPSVLQLIRELGNINVKKKEPPFCYPYSLKARVLVLAHLARMDVSEELEEGRTLKFEVTGIILFKKTCGNITKMMFYYLMRCYDFCAQSASTRADKLSFLEEIFSACPHLL